MAFERSEEAFIGAIAAAQEKAITANAYRRPTSDMRERLNAGKLEYLALPSTLPMDGGVPIRINGIHCGALGVSGASSETDAKIAEEASDQLLAEANDHAAV